MVSTGIGNLTIRVPPKNVSTSLRIMEALIKLVRAEVIILKSLEMQPYILFKVKNRLKSVSKKDEEE